MHSMFTNFSNFHCSINTYYIKKKFSTLKNIDKYTLKCCIHRVVLKNLKQLDVVP